MSDSKSKRSSKTGDVCRETSPVAGATRSDPRRSPRGPSTLEPGFTEFTEVVTDDPYTTEILTQVFEDGRSVSPVEGAASAPESRKSVRLQTLDAHIYAELLEVTDDAMKSKEMSQNWDEGRLGPSECVFDIASNVGTLIVDSDKLGISSQSNFSSIKASCCVYQGRWIYELMLASKGVMQLGWCTANCRFSQEEGVGDTRDSYAYDGSRLRKWNVTTKKYGEPWMSGDVISCAIDCDIGSITFYRNGVSMGEAFNKVRVGPGYAYFPAVSLSFAEGIQANFGALPLRYPIDGYLPLQAPKAVEVARAELLLTYLHKLLPKMMERDQQQAERAQAGLDKMEFQLPPLTEFRSHQATLMLVAGHIFHRMAPLMRIPYVVESCLVKFMLGLCNHEHWNGDQKYVHKILNLMWTFFQEQEQRECFENLMISLLNGYRFHSFHPEFKYPKMFLALTLSVLRHHRTRRHMLSHVLFERVKFPVFMHIKAPDDHNLATLIPTVWWDRRVKKDDDDEDDEEVKKRLSAPETEEEKETKKVFIKACDKLTDRVKELEIMQVELLKCLLVNNDLTESKTSRDLFLERLKTFLKENSGFSRGMFLAQSYSPAVSLCFFHRLVQVLRYYWDEFASIEPAFLPSSEAFTPLQCFWSDTRDYFEFLRCGGLMSHLNRQLGSEVNRAQGIEIQDDGRVVKRQTSKDPGKQTSEDYPRLEMPSGNSLQELLDCIVMLYHISARKHLGKMCALRDNMQDFIINLLDTEEKLKKCPPDLVEVKYHLNNAKQVFTDKIEEQARQMVWVARIIYSPSKQADLVWLLNVALKTVEKASQYGQLFQYVPEFYIATCVNCFNSLRNQLHPTTSFHDIPNLPNLLTRYAMFLVDHFFDTRIVSNDLKDTMFQALACFTCYPDTLKVLEELPMDRRISMIQCLTTPYENRSWAHTNWILVRIWKGCGFGYRYSHLPNLIPHKAQPTDLSYVNLQKPCPSHEFQSLLAKILLDDEQRSTKFLDSLMNQLNWSFSEFVGIIQEIQTLATQTEPLLLEQRQIKICAACFEVSVCLLRVLEMVATVAPQVFTDWARPSAELFLKRLMQLLSQILTRVTMKDGAFESTMNLPIQGLDSVSYYPILTVTVGVMAQLIVRCGGSSQEKATRCLLRDSGFSLNSLKFVLGQGPQAEDKKKQDKIFSFKKFSEVSSEEIEDVEKLIAYLGNQQATLSLEEETVKDEDLCTICYANPQQTVFVPCGHKTCRTCITQQLLNKKECFFCIAAITQVNDLKGRQILREYFPSASHRK